MQAPTHLLAGIALQKVIDSALVKLEKKINKKKNPSKRLFIINLRWAFIPLIAFFLEGFSGFLKSNNLSRSLLVRQSPGNSNNHI